MNTILVLSQLLISCVVGLYFFLQLRSQRNGKNAIESESQKELVKLQTMRGVSLAAPLSEKTRPDKLEGVIGQEEGIKALKAALCGPNPQHVIIYGPPGVGKTAAARVILKEAINSSCSPFRKGAKFIETDATIMRFDERSIADPLIGSVHDPIYQGAGAYGQAGIPQPKPGAVTKAHGGILFIDEIGELHPMQMNKLLKVLEDRKVMLESAYYSSEDTNIPPHIHDIFKNGLPADFRLVGATTRMPEEIPPAIRSRCVEIFFDALSDDSIKQILANAADKLGMEMQPGVTELICSYAQNGRDAVNLLQNAASLAIVENRKTLARADVEWVAQSGRHSRKVTKKLSIGCRIGCVNGLAVGAMGSGMVLDIEVSAKKSARGKGRLIVTGAVEEESFERGGRRLSRMGTARASVQNVLTVMKNTSPYNPYQYDIHVNFPGGMPVDGPSAGTAIFTAIYSALCASPVDNLTAMTGEISLSGDIYPVGGVASKINAAMDAGAKKVYIPQDNMEEQFHNFKIQVIGVTHITQIVRQEFGQDGQVMTPHVPVPETYGIATAKSSAGAKLYPYSKKLEKGKNLGYNDTYN